MSSLMRQMTCILNKPIDFIKNLWVDIKEGELLRHEKIILQLVIILLALVLRKVVKANIHTAMAGMMLNGGHASLVLSLNGE
jgi:hypothetical protein